MGRLGSSLHARVRRVCHATCQVGGRFASPLKVRPEWSAKAVIGTLTRFRVRWTSKLGVVLARDLQARFPGAKLISGGADVEQHVAQVVGFVDAPGIGLDLPLDIRGTAFQQRVWQALREIPAGKTVSYTEVANRTGAPNAVRAVAGACAANALAVAIPCHRVVRTDGGLSGYRWGAACKRALLAKEKQAGMPQERPAPS